MALAIFRRWNCPKFGVGSVPEFRTRFGVIFLGYALLAVSDFWRWLLWAGHFEPQDIACGLAAFGSMILTLNALNEPELFQLLEVIVERRDRHFRVFGQTDLRRETAKVWIVAIAQMPENDFRRRLEPPLLYSPIGGGMAHGATLPDGEAT